MWIPRKKYEAERRELLEVRRSLAQAMNHQHGPQTSEDFIRGWEQALLEVYMAAKMAAPRTIKPRQSRTTRKTNVVSG